MVAELKVISNKDQTCGSPGFTTGGCSPSGKCGNGLEKIYPTCAVRFGYMRLIGEFRYAPGMLFGCGCKVVVQTNRGIELGEQVSLTCTGCDKSIDRKQMMNYVRQSGPEFMELKSGKILRVATSQDLDEAKHLDQNAARQLKHARELASELGLAMKFVTCEHLLGGERLIFYFMSEERVDFRDLVRQLAQEYHTRIEMHQVGARDEARLVADYEICGRECCCKNFLKKLRRVTMRMAKVQKATLDPTKVSGRCGRLRCCLRYEHEGYEELNAKLPRAGTRIRTPDGIATIRDRQILTQLLNVQYDGQTDLETIPIEDVIEQNLPQLSEEEAAAQAAPEPEVQGNRPAPRSRRRPSDDRQRGRQAAEDQPDAPPPRLSEDRPVADEAPEPVGQEPASGSEPKGQRQRRRRRRGRRGQRPGDSGRGPGNRGGGPAPKGQPPEA
jgi:cell fate regulator YaaT (PSP1 superfamily)